MAAKIWFGDYAFHLTGTPQFGRRVNYEAQAEGTPAIERTTYTLKQEFTEEDFASNEAGIAALWLALSVGEGIFKVEDERGGVIVEERVTVKEHDCPQAWRQYVAEVTMTFSGRAFPTASSAAATYTPTGGTAIALPNVIDWRENVRTERFSVEVANRRETLVQISARGFILADASLALAARRGALLTKQAELRGTHSKDGVLVFAGHNATVRVEALDADLGDASDRLEWSLQCFYRKFPDGEFAEADFKVATRDGLQAGEVVVSVRGTVRARTRELAVAKVAALRGIYVPAGSELLGNEFEDDRVHGADGDTWILATFGFEARTLASTLRWELRVTTREDTRTADNTINYDGSVRGKSLAAALAKAQELGRGKHPFPMTATETISKRQREGEPEQFVQVDFSYEYVAKNTYLFAEVSSSVTRDPFGDHRQVVSGYTAATDEATAVAFAQAFKIPYLLLRDQEQNTGRRVLSPSQSQFMRCDFRWVYYLIPSEASASYSREEIEDDEALEKQVTFSGTAFGPSQAACHAIIDAIVGSQPAGMRRRRKSRVASFERQTAGTHLMSVTFQEQYTGNLSAGNAVILQAEYRLRTQFSVNKSVITTIPYGTPHVQTACGWTIGQKSVRGSVVASSEATARAWARAKRSLLAGGHDDPAEEEVAFEFAPFESNTPKTYRVDFGYSARFPLLTL